MSNPNKNPRPMSLRDRGPGIDQEALRIEGDEIDKKFDFERYTEGKAKVGWLLNFMAISMPDDAGEVKSGLDLYFIDREGTNFKATVFYQPYFYLSVTSDTRLNEIVAHLGKRFDNCRPEIIAKEDLDLPNHLSGKKNNLIKLSFNTVKDLMDVKSSLRPVVLENKKRSQSNKDEEFDFDDLGQQAKRTAATADPFSCIIDMREYDVPYTMRVTIDMDLRVGSWHTVTPIQGSETCHVVREPEILELCQPKILAFDIECEKDELKFPNPEKDRIYMISYMHQGQGYLLINRDVVSEDIDDFEYTQLAQYPGPFEVVNLANEEAVLKYFIEHIQKLKPHVIVTYNGDFFDWPYVDRRCKEYSGLDLYKQLGMRGGGEVGGSGGEYDGRAMVHLDAFCWVNRDSYLPQGNRGLKAVTKAKLGYDPIEIDPEDMLPLAKEDPHMMAAYSVSDAVATYYLYTKYVHNFIFSLSTIIPLVPEDVLRKGSGTLCEALLMVEAYRGNVICPNKQQEDSEKFYEGHLLEAETYIGGHVECLEAGVFRADIPNKFDTSPSAFQSLIDHVDRDLTFAIEVEMGLERHDVVNYDDARQEIIEKLEMLRDRPVRDEKPAIYHLDVGAMYPNIILTNRLQPSSMVSESDCAACDYNQSSNRCKRNMAWTWRGDFNPADQSEYKFIRNTLMTEVINGTPFSQLSQMEQARIVKARMKLYSQRVYKKTKVTKEEERIDTVCMRENSFYIDTVRAFRDRRYEYKMKTKTYKGLKSKAEKAGDAVARKQHEDMEILMDSLQLAHKCILNSFYGYVMRKGARWRSMEMAGIVTQTGATLITKARELVEQIGRPLELDTDGIWCILPSSFPQLVTLHTRNGKKMKLEYPAAMLNADVHANYTNDQYQTLLKNGQNITYDTHSECSIYFELDGPYKCMVLPASPEEGKLLKKKYAVYNFDGSISELKGFELKRRGELEIVKSFQQEVFQNFLQGTTLQECYKAVGDVGNYFLSILDSHGEMCEDDDELLGYISEKKTISKTVEDYEGRKATALTTAMRLADFLGNDMVKDKGLNCNLIIAKLPAGAPVTERAIPVTIFSADESTRDMYLRKWLKEPSLDCSDFRKLVDWDYYRERLSKSIQKIVTIPSGLQAIANPVPSIEHPAWLQRSLKEHETGMKQAKLTSIFRKVTSNKDKLRDQQALVSSKLLDKGTKQGEIMRKYGKTREPLTPSICSPNRTRTSRSPSRSPGSGRRSQSPSVGSRSPGAAAEGSNEKKRQMPVSLSFESPPSSPGQVLRKQASSVNKCVDGLEEDLGNLTFHMRDKKPETNEELQGWLSARKQKWKKTRAERKKLEKLRVSSLSAYHEGDYERREGVNAASKKPKSVDDMVRSATLAATLGYWQIVELQETDALGEYVVWAMTDRRQLQRLKVTIPRTVYVNAIGDENSINKIGKDLRDVGGLPMQRFLPHNHPCGRLFEVNFSESKFQKNVKGLANLLTNPNVEGIYETQVPLWFRGVCNLGCVSRVIRSSDLRMRQQAAGKERYNLEELEFINTRSHPYLETSTAVFRKIYIYNCHDKARNSGLGAVGLFIVDQTNVDEREQLEEAQREAQALGDDSLEPAVVLSAHAYVWIVNGPNTSQDARPPMAKVYRKFQKDLGANVTFDTFVEANMIDAFRKCDEKVNGYVQKRQGPTLAVCQGLLDARSWRKQVPALQQLPCAAIATNSSDNIFPAVGWQLFCAERMIQRFLMFPRWVEDRLQCSRFAHVPLCNLGADALTSIIDVVYARQLTHNRHLLWASPTPYPDLGGLAESDQAALWKDSLAEPKINTQGAYRRVCVELDVFGLPINAIMGSGALPDVGQATVTDSAGVEGLAGAHAGAFSDSSCSRAFQLLKGIVTKWVEDINVRADAISDEVLMALYRYLCGFGDALLYDPALHRVVYNLMTKVFRSLVGELGRLGATIVYADFSRIVLHTNKVDLASAQEYVNFLVGALGNRDMFAYLTITPGKYFEQLVWEGPENFGALLLDEDGVISRKQALEEVEKGGENRNDMSGYTDTSELLHHDAAEDAIVDSDDEDAAAQEHVERSRKSVTFGQDSYHDDGSDAEQEGGELDWMYEGQGEQGHGQGMDDYYDHGESLGQPGDYSVIAEPEDPYLDMHWNMTAHMHPAAAAHFRNLVSEYLYQYRKFHDKFEKQRQDHANGNGDTPAKKNKGTKLSKKDKTLNKENTENNQTMAEDGVDEVEEEEEEEEEEEDEHGVDDLDEEDFEETLATQPLTDADVIAATEKRMRRYISDELTETLLEKVDELRESVEGTNTALTFIKGTVHVLSLDPAFSDEVATLRRTLLSHLEVREYSEQGKYKDSSSSFILRDVICSFCSTCRDMDLLRDAALTEREVNERWRCLHCSNDLDVVEVENRLLVETEGLLAAFLIQDVRCSRTHSVSTKLLSATSNISAPLEMDITPETQRKSLGVLLEVAKFHSFQLLQSTLEELI